MVYNTNSGIIFIYKYNIKYKFNKYNKYYWNNFLCKLLIKLNLIKLYLINYRIMKILYIYIYRFRKIKFVINILYETKWML